MSMYWFLGILVVVGLFGYRKKAAVPFLIVFLIFGVVLECTMITQQISISGTQRWKCSFSFCGHEAFAFAGGYRHSALSRLLGNPLKKDDCWYDFPHHWRGDVDVGINPGDFNHPAPYLKMLADWHPVFARKVVSSSLSAFPGNNPEYEILAPLHRQLLCGFDGGVGYFDKSGELRAWVSIVDVPVGDREGLCSYLDQIWSSPEELKKLIDACYRKFPPHQHNSN